MKYLLILWISFDEYRLDPQYTYFTYDECMSLVTAVKREYNPYGSYQCFAVTDE